MNLLRHWSWLIFGLLLLLATVLLAVTRNRKATCESVASEPNPTDRHLQLADQANTDFARLLDTLFVRTGLEAREARRQLVRLGFVDAAEEPVSAEVSSVEPQAAPEEFRREFEEAIRNGLRFARLQDDYDRVGDEWEQEESGEEFTVTLFDEKVSDELQLCAKLLINLQEMRRRNEFPEAGVHLEDLIARIDERTSQLRESLEHRATFHSSEVGTALDRRFYYFQVGIVEHLRRTHLFPELAQLYRPGTTESALDFDIQTVFRFLQNSNELFVRLEQMDRRRLLDADEVEIEELVQRMLPEAG